MCGWKTGPELEARVPVSPLLVLIKRKVFEYTPSKVRTAVWGDSVAPYHQSKSDRPPRLANRRDALYIGG